MSGICGIVRFNGQAIKKEEIQNMLNAMKNRGNDSEGMWVEGNVGFGHKMLWTTPESLYDNQPQVSQNGDLTITADARIDNREELFEKLEIDENKFNNITDTVLVLWSYEKWGEECPKYLLGDFVFAIFDKKKNKLFFAKDHIGIRPFYYYIDKCFFCFSSEISPIFSLSSVEKIRDDNAIETFLESTTLAYEETLFQNIKRLPPAHKISLVHNDITFSRYWFPEELKIDQKITFEEATQKFKILLQEAIQVRLRSAYPIGCELSGGLDSSSILCLTSRINREKDIFPFSQRYGNLECDESYYSDLVADVLGMHVQTVRVDKLDYNKEYSLKKYFQSFPDWPTYGSFMGLLPIAKKAERQNIRILLTGQGGDHIVGGNLYILSDYLRTLKFCKLYKELKYYKWSKKIIKNYIIKPILPKYIFKIKDFLTFKKRKIMVSQTSFFKKIDHGIKDTSLAFNESLGYVSGTLNAFWCDSNIYHNIEKFNIESRHPYFDVRLVEFCLSLPEEYKLKQGVSKRILKEAMKGILPEQVRSRNDKAEFSEAVMGQLIKETNNEKQDIISFGILKMSMKIGLKKWLERNFTNGKESLQTTNTQQNG